jgi:hypothetical protein
MNRDPEYYACRPWRKTPFEVDGLYLVVKDWRSISDRFVTGETLTFKQDRWDPHCGTSCYSFLDSSGRARQWEIYDEDDLALWKIIFRNHPSSERPPSS